MHTTVLPSHASQPWETTHPRSYVAEGVLLVFALLVLGVLEPEFYAVNFNAKTTWAAIGEGAPNLFNQLKWLGLAVLASIAVAFAPSRLLRFSIAMWPLLLLLGYCVLSALWSAFPEIALRRNFGTIIPAYCLCVAIAYIDRPERALMILYLAFWGALLFNLAAFPLSSAFDEFGLYRGVTSNKNTLGGIGGLAILFGLALRPWLERSWSRNVWIVYVAGWAIVLVLCVSKTSIALVFAVPLVFVLLTTASRFFRVSMNIVGLSAFALASVVLGLCYATVGSGPFDLVSLVWGDPTFTGRTEMWSFVLNKVRDNWLTGVGFGSFWGIGPGAANFFSVHDFIRLSNQAHNGYLDILAALGIVGLALLAVLFLHFAVRASSLNDFRLFRLVLFIVLFSLLHGSMESSFLLGTHHVWQLTLFAICIAVRFSRDEERSSRLSHQL